MSRIGNIITKSKEKAYSYLYKSIDSWYKANELKELMRLNGFGNVTVIKKVFGLIAIHIGEKNGD